MDGRVPVNWLRAFEVAARHLSLSGAATELSVTPAAVSQQVRLLEHRLGQQLFVRHARGLRLTLAGEALAPACRDSFERLEVALSELFGNRRRQQLVVRVALGFVRQALLDRLAEFSRRHRDVPLRIVASVWDANPVDANVDLDIRLASGPVVGRESHRLTEDRVFPVCAPAFAMRVGRIRSLSDLLQVPLIGTIGFAEGWKQWFAAAGVAQEPTASIEFDSMRLALEMATLGHGVALARSSYVEDLLRTRQLKRVLDLELAASDNVFLTHARQLEADAPAARLRDWLLAGPRQRSRR
jgi:LysR family glycine cleavage system transcriptional activator